MTRQRYIPQDNQWVDYAEFDTRKFHEAVYAQVGARFPLQTDSRGHTVFDPADLPDGVTENEVKQAVRDNHPHR